MICGRDASEDPFAVCRLRLDFEFRQRQRVRRAAPINDPLPCMIF